MLPQGQERICCDIEIIEQTMTYRRAKRAMIQDCGAAKRSCFLGVICMTVGKKEREILELKLALELISLANVFRHEG